MSFNNELNILGHCFIGELRQSIMPQTNRFVEFILNSLLSK